MNINEKTCGGYGLTDNSFVNFLTGNGEYMTITHCMNGDSVWIAALVILCMINIVLYLAVFREALSHYRKLQQKTPIAKGFLTLAGVFASCAFSGYAMDILGVYFPYYRIKVLALIPLVIFTSGFVYYIKNSNLIGRMFALEQEHKKEFDKLKKLQNKL